MPAMTPTNSPMISGRSGLPKFMLSVNASGSAPTEIRSRQLSATSWPPPPPPLVDGLPTHQRLDREVGHDHSVQPQYEPPGLGDPADNGEVELPFGEDASGLGLATRPKDHQHTLLALAQHDFVGAHAC